MKFRVLSKKHLKRKIRIAYNKGYHIGQSDNHETLLNEFKIALKEKEKEFAAILFSLARDGKVLAMEDNGVSTEYVHIPTQLTGSYLLIKTNDSLTDTVKYRAAHMPPRG